MQPADSWALLFNRDPPVCAGNHGPPARPRAETLLQLQHQTQTLIVASLLLVLRHLETFCPVSLPSASDSRTSFSFDLVVSKQAVPQGCDLSIATKYCHRNSEVLGASGLIIRPNSSLWASSFETHLGCRYYCIVVGEASHRRRASRLLDQSSPWPCPSDACETYSGMHGIYGLYSIRS